MAALNPPSPVDQRPAEVAGEPMEGSWLAARVRRAQDGDRDAFGDLYRRYARLVHGILVARLPAAEAPDLVQDVFVLVLRKLRDLRDPAAFAPWLATLARRAAADHYRTARARPPAGAAVMPGAVSPGLTAEGLAVYEALAALPEAYRETLVLRLVEGMSGAEIAAATGLTAGSVRVNLSRGMKQLRSRLQGAGDE